jgi:uncharacterized DUF497 family protein
VNPQNIAWATAYLLSPIASSYVSGEVLRVNGPITPNQLSSYQLSVISYQWVSYQLSNSKMENVFVIVPAKLLDSVGEFRFLTIGQSKSQKLLVISHTERENEIRLISVRLASKQEKKL